MCCADLEFPVPPKFIDEGTSRDVIVKEGDSAQLTCQATGNPMPKIRWSREDGKSIRKGQKSKSFQKRIINLPQNVLWSCVSMVDTPCLVSH